MRIRINGKRRRDIETESRKGREEMAMRAGRS